MKTKNYFFNFRFVSLILIILSHSYIYGLNYSISFTGSGASTNIESVVVRNLTRGTTVTVPSGNVLNLTDITTSSDYIANSNADGIKVFPNPISENAMISFYAKQSGNTQISAYSLDGRMITKIEENLLEGYSKFNLSLPKGIFLIKVNGNGFSYHAKVVSESANNHLANISNSSSEQNKSKLQKTNNTATTMYYSAGDQLHYKGISGNYSCIIADRPSESKTVDFEFVECRDGDNNYYTTVKIGNQIWMTENLKTTKFNDHTDISLVTSNSTWSTLTTSAYCWYNNDETTSQNKKGALYNWYAVNTGKLAPIGWRVPSVDDWETLKTYLTNNGFNYDGTYGGDLYRTAKSLASNVGWEYSSEIGAVGNNDFFRYQNITGFEAIPCGYRNNSGGFYSYTNRYSIWWTSTERLSSGAWYRYLQYLDSAIAGTYENKKPGYSVRCIKN